MPVPQNPARLPEAFWTKGSWHRQDSKRQRCLWAIPWKLNASQNSLESESREAASEHFASHSCCWPLCFIIFEKLFFPPEYFHLCLLVISRRIIERLREGWTLIPVPAPWCSLPCLLSPSSFTYEHGFGSWSVYFTFYWSVRGNTDRKTKQNPSQNGITKRAQYLKEANIRVPRTHSLIFLPYKAPSESLPALAGDQLIWKLITGGERSVFTVELQCNPCLGVPASRGFLSVLS